MVIIIFIALQCGAKGAVQPMIPIVSMYAYHQQDTMRSLTFCAGSSPGLSWVTVDTGYGCIVGGRRYEDAPAKKLSPEKLKMCSNDVILNV